MHDKCGRWMERRKRVVPREVCVICSERSNQHCKVLQNTQKSAEVIVTESGRTESVGVSSTTEKGEMTDCDRKHKQWLFAKR